jgi:hypothetical protein
MSPLYTVKNPTIKELTMRYRDTDFPHVEEILMAVAEYIESKCGGEWPDDDWISIGQSWSINVWDEGGRRRIAVYRDTMSESSELTTDSDAGIMIQ